jgi:hypothetical protein
MDARGGFVAVPQGVHHDIGQEQLRGRAGQPRRSDAHLRSCRGIRNYGISASDGNIGNVQGMLVEEETWVVRYFIVNTSNWWLGHQVLIAPSWIREVNWLDASIDVDLTRQQVQESPPYDADAALNRHRESGLFKHYGRKIYWTEPRRSAAALAED